MFAPVNFRRAGLIAGGASNSLLCVLLTDDCDIVVVVGASGDVQDSKGESQ